ncbi:MAG: 16S rRNA (uracil(1498)-N(3))-methyltransferase [Deltaproteobacteria bacterium]|nr:16S rRNA (uracil(1498)-N(3))-methyltransferase [Deltaproteobacteria bacterium]
MPQFLINPESISSGYATISGKDALHITTVLRLKENDWLMLTDGKGNRWKAEITKITRGLVLAKLVLKSQPSLKTTDITLALAMIKQERFEWALEKSVELGCRKIIPVASERSLPKPSSPKFKRWQKIVEEAQKQCGTAFSTLLEIPTSFGDLLKNSGSFENKILFWEGENSTGLQKCSLQPSSTLIIIGPEGGFTAEEIKLTKELGIATAGLGPLILRVETAAIAAISLVQYRLGYFDETPQKDI